MVGKIAFSLAAVCAVAAIFGVFAIPVSTQMIPAAAHVSAGVRPTAAALATQESSVRGVIEMIDEHAERIRVSGKDYAFSPVKVRVSNKAGKVSVSALRVGDRTECVVIDDGAKQYLSEVWVET